LALAFSLSAHAALYSWQDEDWQGRPHSGLRVPDNRVFFGPGHRRAASGIGARVLDAESTNLTTAAEIFLRDDGGNGDLPFGGGKSSPPVVASGSPPVGDDPTFNFPSDFGVIPQGGITLSFEHALSGMGNSITSVQFILTFNDTGSLSGTSGGIQGHLILGTTSSSPFIKFYPVADNPSSGTYTYTATSSSFNGLNPNDTWGLVLWDNSNSHMENALNGWSLSITATTAVPEPVTLALGVFGVVFAGVAGARRFRAGARLAGPGQRDNHA
jgi:hypothetical protein